MINNVVTAARKCCRCIQDGFGRREDHRRKDTAVADQRSELDERMKLMNEWTNKRMSVPQKGSHRETVD